MGRLIDIDEAIKIINNHIKKDNKLDNNISYILEEVQTAFDKEELIDLLKRKAAYYHDYNSELFNFIIDILFIIERRE